jgi:hypothetical protein
MPDKGLTSGQTRWIRTLLDSAALSAESEPDKDRSKASCQDASVPLRTLFWFPLGVVLGLHSRSVRNADKTSVTLAKNGRLEPGPYGAGNYKPLLAAIRGKRSCRRVKTLGIKLHSEAIDGAGFWRN